jgi:transcriptional regulator with XRE-family HTH domain
MFEPLPALIRLSREQQKLTLDALSTLAGVSRSRLAALEKETTTSRSISW